MKLNEINGKVLRETWTIELHWSLTYLKYSRMFSWLQHYLLRIEYPDGRVFSLQEPEYSGTGSPTASNNFGGSYFQQIRTPKDDICSLPWHR